MHIYQGARVQGGHGEKLKFYPQTGNYFFLILFFSYCPIDYSIRIQKKI